MRKAEIRAAVGWMKRVTSQPYNQSALDLFPKHGVVAFTSNNRQATYELLKRPAEVFDFSLKDFSILEDVDLRTRVRLLENSLDPLPHDEDVSAENQQKNFESLSEEIDRNESNVGTVFVSDFLRNVGEAEKLEKETLGLNLFINFKAAENESPAELGARICQHCGNVERGTADENQKCEATAGNCEIVEYNAEHAQQTQESEVAEFYRRRGNGIDFVFDSSEDLTTTRTRLIQAVLQHFKY